MVIDYYSEYIEAIRLNGKTSSDVRYSVSEWKFLKTWLSSNSNADNMPYNARQMREYATQYGINIATTSRRYNQGGSHY